MTSDGPAWFSQARRSVRIAFRKWLVVLIAAVVWAPLAGADLLVVVLAGEAAQELVALAIELEDGQVFYVDEGRVLARIDERSFDLVERLSIDTPLLIFPCVGWSPPCSQGLISLKAWVHPAGRDDFVAALVNRGGTVEEESPFGDGTIFFRVAAPADAVQPLSERPEVDRLSLDGPGAPPGGGPLGGQPTLFLGEGWRFTLEAQWQTDGASGPGIPVQWTTDTGAFFFFRRDNIELVVKVLEGCSLTGHYWVFAAGMTNVGVTLTVRSPTASRTYVNPVGQTFVTITDTLALPCD